MQKLFRKIQKDPWIHVESNQNCTERSWIWKQKLFRIIQKDPWIHVETDKNDTERSRVHVETDMKNTENPWKHKEFNQNGTRSFNTWRNQSEWQKNILDTCRN